MTGAGEPDRLLEVGRVVKPHGLLGEVVVELWSDRPGRLEPGTVVETDGPAGRGSLRILGSRRHQGRHLVFFDGVVDRNGADRLRGTVLMASPLEEPGTLWVHELVGAEVVTVDGEALGRVAAVEANPASDLLVLDRGGLVPLRFVTDFRAGGRVTVEVPPGLFE